MRTRPAQTLDDAAAGLHALYPAPPWARGVTPKADAEFLLQMIAIEQPRRIVELGVASGVSSAVILYALDTLPDIPGGRWLHSCDIQPTCYFDPAYATGDAVRSMYPHPRSRWVLDTDLDARRLSQAAAGRDVDLTFIDANHCHPWPLLDLLHMTAIARPQSWIILHDINLPVIHAECQIWGAKWLFDAWPFEKLTGASVQANIGAVRLPRKLPDLIPVAAELLHRPWEFAPTLWHVAMPAPFGPLQEIVRARLSWSGADPVNR
ncbi:MAG: class I SAM-dependent methyltransferase [Acidobacteriota bacterium]|nr:class I SAM-dependent methyltransferase [Acidobacteriota bacterium]